MSDHTTLADLGDAVLAAVVDGFSDASVSLPTRQFVADGQVVHDCEQVAVALDRLFTTLPRAEAPDQLLRAMPILWFATFVVHIVRCVPKPGTNGSMPDAADLTDAATTIHTDMWVTGRSLRAGLAGSCESLNIEEGRLITHSGGFGGSTTRLTVQVQG